MYDRERKKDDGTKLARFPNTRVEIDEEEVEQENQQCIVLCLVTGSHLRKNRNNECSQEIDT